MAALFFLLRHSIDRRKGAISEVAAVTLPLVLAALLFVLGDWQRSRVEFGIG